MMGLTMLANSQVFAGGVEIAEPVERLQGALLVVGEVHAVELSGGPATRLRVWGVSRTA